MTISCFTAFGSLSFGDSLGGHTSTFISITVSHDCLENNIMEYMDASSGITDQNTKLKSTGSLDFACKAPKSEIDWKARGMQFCP